MRRTILLLCALLVSLALAAPSQDLAAFEKKVAVKKLPNGLTLIVCERPEAPVFSFFTYVDSGAVQDPKGQGGLAHMFEHMAFKGTDKIGTNNYPAERVALARVEAAYTAYDAERRRGDAADKQKLAQLKATLDDHIKKANEYVAENEFSKIIDANGGQRLNAFTAMDLTGYFYEMPSNRVELWAYLESERFLHPVFREFYTERDVVHEERRLRVDSSPIGRLVEQFVAASFVAHPYHNEGIGFPSELEAFSASDAAAFFKVHYIPANMVVAMVGDVKAKEVLPIAERYFSRLPAAPKPAEISLIEPPQIAERRLVIREGSQPIYLEGYHKPSYRDPDDAVYDVMTELMSTGRTSRMYRALVRDKKIAVVAQGFSGFPGNKYPNLFAFFVVPARGHSPTEVEAAVQAEIERLKNEDVTDDELKMVKTRVRANLIRSLADNSGLAQNLATYQTMYGDWRELFHQVDNLDKVTKADIRRVANKIFVPSNRNVAYIETAAAPAQGAK